MPCNTLTMTATPDEVFDVLLDARAYPAWVVGTRKVRAVDDDWPRPGSKFHHSVGTTPAHIDDSSKLLALDAPRMIRLEVRVRPLGVGVVEITVDAVDADRVRVRICEEPSQGPAERWWNPALDAATYARNLLSLHRLERVVRRRAATSRTVGAGVG